MEAWVVANEEQQLLDMIWNGNLTVGLCVELKVSFLYFLTTLLIGSLLWSYSRLFEVFHFIKRKLDGVIVVNLGVLYHPGHDALYCILNTTTLNENKLVCQTCSATS